MKSTKVATRYAKSLLDLAIEQDKINSILVDMNFLLVTNSETRDFERLIASPIVNTDKKIEIFEKVFAQFEDVSMSFVKFITKNRRESHLPAIAQSFSDQLKEFKGIVPMTITSAAPLDCSIKDKIVAKVQDSVKGQLEIEEKIDESLIGGFLVRMGDMQIDASVSNQFNNLKQRLAR